MSLTVGHIAYANCVPFFHFLSDCGFTGRIVSGVPSELNRLLAKGAVDVSPSSSFEYGRNWRDYVLLPGHSISTFGPVKSVLLLSPLDLDELEGQEIALTGESATSINLVKVLLQEYLGLTRITYQVPEEPVEEVLARGGSGLLIGDRALRAADKRNVSYRIYDLGELWHRFTGLPFVFALWIARREAVQAHPEEFQILGEQLTRSRLRAFSSLDTLAAHTPERRWMSEEGLADYWRCMSYDLGERHRQGLELYFRLLVKYGLLPEMPEIRFLQGG
jgi:chorismate dehydratase